MNTTRLSLLTIAAALALAGCGNKGPLVLPDEPEDAATSVAADEADAAAADADEAPVDGTTTDGTTTDDTTTEDPQPVDDTGTPVDPDAPVEPEPLPQDDGDGG